ncbi:MAG: hypothetical protein AABW48_03565 [Nanoarchaeota archaeon]
MIPVSFLTEFEISLLKAYNRASHKSTPIYGKEADFVGAAQYQNEFIQAFMSAFQEQHALLERELRKGGNDPVKTLSSISRDVESKLRTLLFQRRRLDTAVFQSFAKDMKKEVRSVFYGLPGVPNK